MTTTNEIERVILNLEDRIAQLQAELDAANTCISLLRQEAIAEAGLALDYRDDRDQARDELAEQAATIARLREALERIAMCPTDGCDGLVHLAKTALAEQPS